MNRIEVGTTELREINNGVLKVEKYRIFTMKSADTALRELVLSSERHEDNKDVLLCIDTDGPMYLDIEDIKAIVEELQRYVQK